MLWRVQVLRTVREGSKIGTCTKRITEQGRDPKGKRGVRSNQRGGGGFSSVDHAVFLVFHFVSRRRKERREHCATSAPLCLSLCTHCPIAGAAYESMMSARMTIGGGTDSTNNFSSRSHRNLILDGCIQRRFHDIPRRVLS